MFMLYRFRVIWKSSLVEERPVSALFTHVGFPLRL